MKSKNIIKSIFIVIISACTFVVLIADAAQFILVFIFVSVLCNIYVDHVIIYIHNFYTLEYTILSFSLHSLKSLFSCFGLLSLCFLFMAFSYLFGLMSSIAFLYHVNKMIHEQACTHIQKKKIACKIRLTINISSIKTKSNKNLFQLCSFKNVCVLFSSQFYARSLNVFRFCDYVTRIHCFN